MVTSASRRPLRWSLAGYPILDPIAALIVGFMVAKDHARLVATPTP